MSWNIITNQKWILHSYFPLKKTTLDTLTNLKKNKNLKKLKTKIMSAKDHVCGKNSYSCFSHKFVKFAPKHFRWPIWMLYKNIINIENTYPTRIQAQKGPFDFCQYRPGTCLVYRLQIFSPQIFSSVDICGEQGYDGTSYRKHCF